MHRKLKTLISPCIATTAAYTHLSPTNLCWNHRHFFSLHGHTSNLENSACIHYNGKVSSWKKLFSSLCNLLSLCGGKFWKLKWNRYIRLFSLFPYQISPLSNCSWEWKSFLKSLKVGQIIITSEVLESERWRKLFLPSFHRHLFCELNEDVCIAAASQHRVELTLEAFHHMRKSCFSSIETQFFGLMAPTN